MARNSKKPNQKRKVTHATINEEALKEKPSLGDTTLATFGGGRGVVIDDDKRGCGDIVELLIYPARRNGKPKKEEWSRRNLDIRTVTRSA
jgi:hypothetical protein